MKPNTSISQWQQWRDNKWHLLVVTFDGNIRRYYLDGDFRGGAL